MTRGELVCLSCGARNDICQGGCTACGGNEYKRIAISEKESSPEETVLSGVAALARPLNPLSPVEQETPPWLD